MEQAREWLELAGCKKIFPVCSLTGEGITDILDYLAEEGDIIPWHEAKEKYRDIQFKHGEKEGTDLPYEITVI